MPHPQLVSPRLQYETSQQALTRPDYSYDARLADLVKMVGPQILKLYEAWQNRPGRNFLTEPPSPGWRPPGSPESQKQFKDEIAADMLSRYLKESAKGPTDAPPVDEILRLRQAQDEENVIDPTLGWAVLAKSTVPALLSSGAFAGKVLGKAVGKGAPKILKRAPREATTAMKARQKWLRPASDVGKKLTPPAPEIPELSREARLLLEALGSRGR